MIGKSFLGESLNFLIGQLKLSYRRIFRIIGESLAEVSSGLWRGGLFGVFIAGYAMKPRFFLNNFIFVLMHFRVFLEDQPYGFVCDKSAFLVLISAIRAQNVVVYYYYMLVFYIIIRC